MRPRILLVGAGSLGSRYLQGMSRVSSPLDIYVCEVNQEARKLALARWEEVAGHTTEHALQFVDITQILSYFDLAIIATSADVRPLIVKTITEQSKIRYWVLEKLLAQRSKDVESICDLVKSSEKAWVNTPMHMWPLYSKLRSQIKKHDCIELSVAGFTGMACNAIHFIDYVSRWNGAEVTYLNTSGLASCWHPAKRDGFWEVFGVLEVTFKDGSMLHLTSTADDKLYRVLLKSGSCEWNVYDAKGTAVSNDGRTVNGSCDLQSEMTPALVESILQTGSSKLPTLTESAAQHGKLLEALVLHWNSCMPKKLDYIPAT